MKKNYTFYICCFLLMLCVTGCSSKSTSENLSYKLNNNNVLTVYLNDFDDIIGPLFEEETGYKLNIIQGSGAEILSRIEAERMNPRWDVVWIDMIASVYGLGANGLLYEDFIPEHSSKLTPTFANLIPEQRWYYPTSAHASAVITYSTNELTETEAPLSWAQFSNPSYLNAIGMADPTIAAPAYSFVNSFFHHHGIEEAKAMLNSWFDNGLKLYPKNPNVAMSLMSGQLKIAALQENNAYNLLKEQKPIAVVWPEEGAPAAVRVAAISKQTEKLDIAKAFVNFLLDPAIQQKIINISEEAYHEPSVLGVQQKPDRHPEAKLNFTDTEWSHKHESDIKQWFADYSVR